MNCAFRFRGSPSLELRDVFDNLSIVLKTKRPDVLHRYFNEAKGLCNGLKEVLTKTKRLRKYSYGSVSLTTSEIRILLSSFLFSCVGDSVDMPYCNLRSLVIDPYQSNRSKLRCFLNYITSEVSTRLVHYFRCSIDSPPSWRNCAGPRFADYPVEITNGAIEGDDCFHVDFANKSIGGGVFGHGCVQEEIMFCEYPELAASRAFCDELQENECLIMVNAIKFNAISGYRRSFLFEGTASTAEMKPVAIIAIDALELQGFPDLLQLRKDLVVRELNKAFCGFYHAMHDPSIRNCVSPKIRRIATGHWGCGAFGGDREVKFVIQWMAAVAANVELKYCSFNDETFARDAKNFVKTLSKYPDATPGDVFDTMQDIPTYLKTSLFKEIASRLHGVIEWRRKIQRAFTL